MSCQNQHVLFSSEGQNMTRDEFRNALHRLLTDAVNGGLEVKEIREIVREEIAEE